MGPEQYEVSLPPHLDEAQRWFVPGLCYVYARFPASILQVVKPREAPTVKATTLLLKSALYAPSGFGIPLDNWQRTIQGIRVSDTMRFLSDLSAARFKFSDGKVWKVTPQEMLLNDPLSPVRVVKVFYLLPVAEDHRLVITKIINGHTAIIEKRTNG